MNPPQVEIDECQNVDLDAFADADTDEFQRDTTKFPALLQRRLAENLGFSGNSGPQDSAALALTTCSTP